MIVKLFSPNYKFFLYHHFIKTIRLKKKLVDISEQFKQILNDFCVVLSFKNRNT